MYIHLKKGKYKIPNGHHDFAQYFSQNGQLVLDLTLSKNVHFSFCSSLYSFHENLHFFCLFRLNVSLLVASLFHIITLSFIPVFTKFLFPMGPFSLMAFTNSLTFVFVLVWFCFHVPSFLLTRWIVLTGFKCLESL